eukprot:scaffold155410_cov19-Tisochrysis_lutea.AAC.3
MLIGAAHLWPDVHGPLQKMQNKLCFEEHRTEVHMKKGKPAATCMQFGEKRTWTELWWPENTYRFKGSMIAAPYYSTHLDNSGHSATHLSSSLQKKRLLLEVHNLRKCSTTSPAEPLPLLSQGTSFNTNATSTKVCKHISFMCNSVHYAHRDWVAAARKRIHTIAACWMAT